MADRSFAVSKFGYLIVHLKSYLCIMPKVSILMPVYNSEKYLTDAINSILKQTFSDFEFLVFDDGSIDNSLKIISSYSDSRIHIFKSEQNYGHIFHLNRGLEIAKGKYIARMDADDIAHPERLEYQVKFLERNSDIGVCGTWYKEFGCQNNLVKHPIDDQEIRLKLLFKSCALGHPTVMMRKLIFDTYLLKYFQSEYPAEDYWLWIRISLVSKLANIPKVLLFYRTHVNQVSKTHQAQQLGKANLAQFYYASVILGRDLLPIERDAHRIISNAPMYISNKLSELVVIEYLNTLVAANHITMLIDTKKLSLWIDISYKNIKRLISRHFYLQRQRFDFFLAFSFIFDTSFPYRFLTLEENIKFFIKCLVKYHSKYRIESLKFSSKSVFNDDHQLS